MILALFVLGSFCSAGYLSAYFQVQVWRNQGHPLSSLPSFYAMFVLMRILFPLGTLPVLLWITGTTFYLTSFQICLLSMGLSLIEWQRALTILSPHVNTRLIVEGKIKKILALFALLVVALAAGIFLSLVFETILFFKLVPPIDFLLGLRWSPKILPDGQCVHFGVIPLVTGTFLITLIAIVIAGPCGLFSAIYLSEYSSKRFRHFIKPLLEILAGIPSVVYGFFAAIVVAPWVSQLGNIFGFYVAMESALAAGLVMSFMILPFILSLCDDALQSIPFSLREGAYALGSTSSEAICKVLLPAAFPGIMASFLLALSRAIGETMLVVMAAGMSARLTLNPFHAVTTLTVQIVALLTGDQESDSPKTLAAFSLGLFLFFVTLSLNIFALSVVRKYAKARKTL